VKGNARIVTVQFEEDLVDSTTYTINFGNAIVDLNEKNPLKNYRFSFSTGNEIDTLQISGKVINAADLNPLSGIIVGIYRLDDERGFFTKPFMRIGRTDENGNFVIDNNLKPALIRFMRLAIPTKTFSFSPARVWLLPILFLHLLFVSKR
jgi:hypothetical protein